MNAPAADVSRLLGLAREEVAAGRTERAVARCREVLARDEGCTEAWALLARLHAERGDARRARACRQKAGVPGSDDDLDVQEADLQRFLALFSGREDTHARQWHDASRGRGGYSPVREPLTAGVVRAHLAGKVTVGAYLLRTDSAVRFAVLDLDVTKSALAAAEGSADEQDSLRAALDAELRRLHGVLGQLGLPHVLEDSGRKGRHLWLFLDAPTPAADVHAFGQTLLAAHAPTDARLALEFFPKQARLGGKGLGNLVKLPLGVHRVSGRRSTLLRPDGTVDPRPMRTLRRVARVSPSNFTRAAETLRARTPRRVRDGGPPPGSPAVAPPSTPPAAPPPYGEVELAADEGVQEVLRGCAVLARLATRALSRDALAHDELVALEHTLGHLEHGPQAVNLLLGRVPGVPRNRRLKRRLRGSPSSCSNLRRKLPGLASTVGCGCSFGERLATYRHPLLHRTGTEEAELLELEP